MSSPAHHQESREARTASAYTRSDRSEGPKQRTVEVATTAAVRVVQQRMQQVARRGGRRVLLRHGEVAKSLPAGASARRSRVRCAPSPSRRGGDCGSPTSFSRPWRVVVSCGGATGAAHSLWARPLSCRCRTLQRMRRVRRSRPVSSSLGSGPSPGRIDGPLVADAAPVERTRPNGGGGDMEASDGSRRRPRDPVHRAPHQRGAEGPVAHGVGAATIEERGGRHTSP